MFGGMDGWLPKDGSRIGDHELVDPALPKVLKTSSPAGAAQPCQQSARGAAVQIQAKRKSPGADFSHRSDPRGDLGPAGACSQLENLVHTRIAFQQLAKAGLNYDGDAEIWSPRFQKPQGGGQQHNVADGAQTDDEDSSAGKEAGEE
jgi:hypothetical protein